MRALVLLLIPGLMIASGSALAASYQKTNGTIADPIRHRSQVIHVYAGPNLHPGAILIDIDLNNALLTDAALAGANLSGANLTDADIWDADLSQANLTGANLTGLQLFGVNLDNADLRGANFFGAEWLENTTGTPIYDAGTEFNGAWSAGGGGQPFDPVAAGWTLVPEPNSALLIGIGLVGLSASSRRRDSR